MNFLKKYFYIAVPLFSEIIGFYCVLQIASFGTKRGVIFISFPHYLALSCAAALINCLLGRKERTLVFAVAVNAAAALCTVIIMFTVPHNIYGIAGYTATTLMFLYPAAKGFYLSRKPVNLDRMLRYCELSVVGTGVFIAFQLGYFQPDAIITPLCILSMLLNLLALSALRLSGTHVKNQSAGAQRVFILSMVATLLFAAAAALGFLLPASRNAIIYVLVLLKSLALSILGIIKAIILFIISLIPVEEYEAAAPEPGISFAASEAVEETAALPILVFYVLFFIICAAIIALLIYILYRLRKFRLRTLAPDSVLVKDMDRAPPLLRLLLALIRRLAARVAFYTALLSHYNTYSGVFVRLELLGRRYGCKRSAAQTPREFLTALTETSPENKDELRRVFSELASQIDIQCFKGGHSDSPKMEPAKIRAIFRSLKPVRRNKQSSA